MLGGNHNSGFYFRFWHTRHKPDEVNYKLAVGMGNHRQIRINSFCDFIRKLNIDLILSLLFFIVLCPGVYKKGLILFRINPY